MHKNNHIILLYCFPTVFLAALQRNLNSFLWCIKPFIIWSLPSSTAPSSPFHALHLFVKTDFRTHDIPVLMLRWRWKMMNEVDLSDALSETTTYNPAQPKVKHLTLLSPVFSLISSILPPPIKYLLIYRTQALSPLWSLSLSLKENWTKLSF